MRWGPHCHVWLPTSCFVAFLPHRHILCTKHLGIRYVTSNSQPVLTVPGLWPCWPSCGWQHPICGWHGHFYLGLGLCTVTATYSFRPLHSTPEPWRSYRFLTGRYSLTGESQQLLPGLTSRPILLLKDTVLVHLPVRPCRDPLLVAQALSAPVPPHTACASQWLTVTFGWATALGSLPGWELCFPFLPGPVHRDL